jgi:hypothetical protein
MVGFQSFRSADPADAGFLGRSSKVQDALSTCLEIHAFHLRLRIAQAGGSAGRYGGRDLCEISGRQIDRNRPDVFQESCFSFGAGNWDDVFTLREQPGERELPGRASLPAGGFVDAMDQRQVVGKVLPGKSRMAATGVGFGHLVLIFGYTGEQSAAERRIGNKTDFQLARRAQRLVRFGPVWQREFVLHGGDRMDGVRAANGLRPRLAETKRAHFALLDQAGHRADRVLYRHAWIDSVLIIEIDNFDAEALEAGVAGTQDMFGTPVGKFAVAAAEVSEFRCHHDLFTAPLDRLTDEFLIVAEALRVRGVKKGDSPIQSLTDDGYSTIVAALAINAGE